MRCNAQLPPEVKPFPIYLREQGYFCTNNSKTDYQFKAPKETWDISEKKGALAQSQGSQTTLFLRLQLHRMSRIRYRQHLKISNRHQKTFSLRATRPRQAHHPASILSRYPSRARRLEAQLRSHHRNGRLGRRPSCPTRGRRPSRKHHRLLLVRSRRRTPSRQTLALRLRHPSSSHRPPSRALSPKQTGHSRHRLRSTHQLH